MVFTLLFIENPLLVVFSPILSFIDEKYKESLILALLHQCYEICSKNALIHTEIDNLRNIFQNNGYPYSWTSEIRCFLKKLTEER